MKAGRVTLSMRTVPHSGTSGTPGTVAQSGTVAGTWVVSIGSDGRANVDGESLTVMRGPGSGWRVMRGDHQVTAHVTSQAGRALVHLAGEVYELDVAIGTVPPARSRATLEDGLAAPMPATVRAVLVSPGDTVARGDTLIMLEAMKMELPIRSGQQGTVRAVHCQPGELVQPGVPLVEIE